MDDLLIGAIAMASFMAGLFFLRFWKSTHDRFFLMFALAFWIEGMDRIIIAVTDVPTEGIPIVYVIRLLAYSLIALAIIDKNLPRSRSR